MKTAILIGATGLTGSNLLQLLLKDDRFAHIKIFVRRSTGIQHPKLEEIRIDFDQYHQWKHLVTGDVLFSALGTTLKQAGGKAAQYKVDYTYQLQFAKAASENKVPVYVLVSSASASSNSPFFYMRMKGELERDIKALPFDHIHILQPGPLKGERNEDRLGESVGIAVMEFLNRFGIAKNMRPVPGRVLAQAMLNVSFQKERKVSIYTLLEVFKEAEYRAD